MKKLTGTSLSLAFALSCVATSAMANPLEDRDMAFAFGAESEMPTLLTLSEKEMMETEGSVLPYLARLGGGGAVGGGMYIGSTAYRSWDSGAGNFGFNSSTWNNFKNNWSTNDFAFAAGSGAVGGAYSQSLFRGAGYTSTASQWTAPIQVQVPIRTGGAGAGFSTFGVHGYPTTNFNNSFGSRNDYQSLTCYSCYRGGR